MNKYIAAGLLAGIISAPACAQTYQLTFSGTFTQLNGTATCIDGASGCTDSSFFQSISVPYTQTLTFSFGRDSNYKPGSSSVLTFPGTTVYRTTQILAGHDTPSQGGDELDALHLPQEILVPAARPDDARQYLKSESASAGRWLQINDAGETRTRVENWIVGNDQTWTTGSGQTSFYQSVYVSGSVPANVTPENYGDPFSQESFLALLTGSIGCVNCFTLGSQTSFYNEVGGIYTNYFGQGTSTLLSLTELAVPAVPEPSTLALMVGGLLACAGASRRRGKYVTT